MVGLHVMQDLRNSLYSHLQNMPLRFFTTTRTGEIQSRLSNDVGGVQSVVTDTASNMLSNVVVDRQHAGRDALILSVQLTALSLALMPLFLWLTVKVGRARDARWRTNTQKTLADLTAITEETLSVSRHPACRSRSAGSGTRSGASATRTSASPGCRSGRR